MTLKVHVNTLTCNRELKVYRYLKNVESDHPGRGMIRKLEEYFELPGPYGTHQVFVMPPLGLSLRAFQDMMPGHIFAQPIVRITLQRVSVALDFLHGPANITHTGKGSLTVDNFFLHFLFLKKNPCMLWSNVESRCSCRKSPHRHRR